MVSIVLATYNGKKYLHDLLDSLLVQTYSDFELLICDDCSIDGTYDVLSLYANKDSRIKLERNDKNVGFKKNFENLCLKAHGKYVALCDQDDIWMSDHLELLINAIGDKDLAIGNADLMDENGHDMHCTLRDCDKIDSYPTNKDDSFFLQLYRPHIQGAACLVRAELLKNILPAPDGIVFHDQWIGILAASKNGVAYINESVLKYRQHSFNNSGKHIRWNSISKIFDMLGGEGNNPLYRKQNDFIKVLKESKFEFNEHQIDMISQAERFFSSMISNRRFRVMMYFFKNNFKIYRSLNPVYFFVRFFRIFILKK